jgi:hypothetical protein
MIGRGGGQVGSIMLSQAKQVESPHFHTCAQLTRHKNKTGILTLDTLISSISLHWHSNYNEFACCRLPLRSLIFKKIEAVFHVLTFSVEVDFHFSQIQLDFSYICYKACNADFQLFH